MGKALNEIRTLGIRPQDLPAIDPADNDVRHGPGASIRALRGMMTGCQMGITG